MAEMWQPQCSAVGDGVGGRQEDDKSAVFGHQSATESRFSPAAMLQSQASWYSVPPSQQQQQHLTSLYEQQLQQRYQHHYQLQQQQMLQVSGHAHHSSTAAGQTSQSPAAPTQQPQTSAPTAAASRTTKIPDDQVKYTPLQLCILVLKLFLLCQRFWQQIALFQRFDTVGLVYDL